ncbi:nuclear transport factor 2 family protein, partial [Rhizobium ruizarguesonis]
TLIDGRPALYDYLRNYPEAIDIRSLPTLRAYCTEDPNVAIAEWSASGLVVSNGNPYDMSYATFVTFRDGLIVNYRESWNPQVFLKAMGAAGFCSYHPRFWIVIMTKRLREVCHYLHRRCATALRFAEVVTTIEALGGKPT